MNIHCLIPPSVISLNELIPFGVVILVVPSRYVLYARRLIKRSKRSTAEMDAPHLMTLINNGGTTTF